MMRVLQNADETKVEERCLKCHGLQVPEILSDPDSTLPNRIACLRCLNCGRIDFLENSFQGGAMEDRIRSSQY